MPDDAAPFPYLRWAKANLDSDEALSLGLSGLARPPTGDVPGLQDPLLASGRYPHEALKEALAERYDWVPEGIHLSAGTSHGNFLVYLTFARGGRAAAETPAYEAFHCLGEAVGAEVVPFKRRAETGWRIDEEDLVRAARPGTRLVALTDLHNPSGARLHPDDLALTIEVIERVGGYLLVDEVYLDLDPEDRPSAVHRHPRVLITNSLTKAHGLGDLRTGWILGAPELVAEIATWDDLVCPVLPLLPMKEALAYLPLAQERLAEVRRRAAIATEVVDAWVASRSDVRWIRPEAGFTGFLLLGTEDRPLDGDLVAARTLELADVRVVPGSFFQAPHGVRISYLLEESELLRALAGLGSALDACASAKG